MKNLDFKKLLVLLLIIAAIVAVVFFIVKKVNKDSLTKEEIQTVEKRAIDYYATLTLGYTSNFGGIDNLYQNDETTFDKLEKHAVIYAAIRYAESNNINTAVNKADLDVLNSTGVYGNINDYAAFKGEAIRTAVKELFGDVNYTDSDAANNTNFLYDFYYNKKYDIYLMKSSSAIDVTKDNRSIEHHIISTKSKDDKITTTIAIAYILKTDKNNKYAADKDFTKVIGENLESFPTDKVDQFDKFEITVTKTETGYKFESIKKVK